MTEKSSFQDTFFPATNPEGNKVIFGDTNQSIASEEMFGNPDEVLNDKGSPIESAEDGETVAKSKKESRRTRPAAIVEKQLLKEANHWKSTAIQESEKLRAIEQQNMALQQQLSEIEQARRHSELKALSEREDNLRMQRKIAVAAGEHDYADEVSAALNQAMIQKEIQTYDRHVKQSQPQYSNYQEPQHQQYQVQQSPIESMRQQAFDEFVYRNPWYGKNPNLTREADSLIEELTNVLQLDNNDDAVYSNPFFQTVEQALKDARGLTQSATSNQSASHHYDEPSNSRPSTRFSDVPRGNTMAEDYANRYGGGRTFTPDEVRRSGSQNLQMKVGNKWVSGPTAIKTEADKHRQKIKPINKGFRIEYQ